MDLYERIINMAEEYKTDIFFDTEKLHTLDREDMINYLSRHGMLWEILLSV